MYLNNYKHLLKQIAKKKVLKFIHMKKVFWGKKTYNAFLQLVHYIPFAPKS